MARVFTVDRLADLTNREHRRGLRHRDRGPRPGLREAGPGRRASSCPTTAPAPPAGSAAATARPTPPTSRSPRSPPPVPGGWSCAAGPAPARARWAATASTPWPWRPPAASDSRSSTGCPVARAHRRAPPGSAPSAACSTTPSWSPSTPRSASSSSRPPARGATHRPGRRIRPVVPGVRGGWIRTGVSWETFAGGYYGFGRVSFADEQRDVLTAIADAHRRSVRAFGYGRMPDAILLDHLGPSWVALLRAADRAGVRLLTNLGEGGEVAFAPEPRRRRRAHRRRRRAAPAPRPARGRGRAHDPGRAAGHRLLPARRRDPRAGRPGRAARRHPAAPARPRRRRGARGRLGPVRRHPPARAATQGAGAGGIRRPRPARCRAAAAHAARHLRGGPPGAPGVGASATARPPAGCWCRWPPRSPTRCATGLPSGHWSRSAARGRRGRRFRPAVAGRGPGAAPGARNPAARLPHRRLRRAAAGARGAAVGRADRGRRAGHLQRGRRRPADPGVDVRPRRGRGRRLVRPRRRGHGGGRGHAVRDAVRGAGAGARHLVLPSGTWFSTSTVPSCAPCGG